MNLLFATSSPQANKPAGFAAVGHPLVEDAFSFKTHLDQSVARILK
jgi:hypothetical protein